MASIRQNTFTFFFTGILTANFPRIFELFYASFFLYFRVFLFFFSISVF